MDEIKIGLDFGTHQTKICIQRRPDEGHGLPEYEFFPFVDEKGKQQFFLPSVIQINKDDTLSYGYVDPDDKKEGLPMPRKEIIQPVDESRIDEDAQALYSKYSTDSTLDEEGMNAIVEMLSKKYEIDKRLFKDREIMFQKKYEEEMAAYIKERNLFRYFKQAAFADHPWDGKHDSVILCIWYLAYILFLLEEKFPDGFAINMGIPTDDKSFHAKRELATQVLISAYHLVEDVYNHNISLFLKEKVEDLAKQTEIPDFSEDDKDLYRINVFPEAYASLIGLTSRGKLSEGMSVNADIGGGTTDISFFIVRNRVPKIYKYWSIPRGLNYIAENSGFDYSEGDFIKKAHEDIIDNFNHKKDEIVYNLVLKLIDLVRNSSLQKSNLIKALSNRVLVYNGGGSTFDELTTPIYYFSDIKIADASLWEEEIVKDKKKVSKLFNLLTTAYGLSVSDDDNEIELCDFDSIFSAYINKDRNERQEIDKDVC